MEQPPLWHDPAEPPTIHIHPLLARVPDAAPPSVDGASGILQRRDEPPMNNAMIGALVGVLLFLFIVGCVAFCYFFRDTIRAAQKKRSRQRRRKSHTSKGSKGSEQPPAPA